MKLLNEFPSPKFTRLGTVYIQGAYRSVYTLLNTHDVMIRVSSKRGPEEKLKMSMDDTSRDATGSRGMKVRT